MPTVLRALLLSALLTLIPVAIGVVVSDETAPPPARKPAAYTGTPLSEFDSTKAVVRRAPFCELVPAEAVKAALGTEASAAGYDNGEQTEAIAGGCVAHEYGCRASATEGATPGLAEAWVFAPPVTADWAQRLVAAAGRTPGCAPLPGTPAYGAPSVGLVCTNGDQRSITFRGLYGDAWLACSLSLPAGLPQDQLVDRAGRWCVAVAQAAAVPVG
ncbi:hypothetical protein [Pimelobacter simplex]|uniref:hypothetical protein n=1 Tax=Nocardioides simplex TaxID=2045 RepID=UPI0021504F0B|nr:hypothetical protein [Pimelobacter simplex]UUW92583.1 hypothetical protein M0M43_14185 [Pimelobacter simplex]UUW96410.1 hypothetical protein M0M48_02815 [Pimelobacter simplex]